MFETDVSMWVILVAGVAGWIVGAIWYGVFANPWTALAYPGKKKEDIKGSTSGYLVALVAYVVAAYVLAVFSSYYGVESVSEGISIALFAFVGFTATTLLLNFTFSQRSLKLYAIDAGNYLVGFLVMGAIIGLGL